MAKLLNKIIQIIDKISSVVGMLIAPLTLIMMLLTCLVVILRYLFDIGATSLQEATIYLHGLVFMLGISYTLNQSGHVRVDIFYQTFTERQKAIVNLLGTILFLLPLGVFILWTSLEYVAFSWSLNERSPEPGGLPFVYLLKTLIPVMSLLLLLQGLAELLKSLNVLITRDPNNG